MQRLHELPVRLGVAAVRPDERLGLVAEQELHVAVERRLETRPLAEGVAEGVELRRGQPAQRGPGGVERLEVPYRAPDRPRRGGDVVLVELPLGQPPLRAEQPEVELHHLGGDQERQLLRGVGDGVLELVQGGGAHVVVVGRAGFEPSVGSPSLASARALRSCSAELLDSWSSLLLRLYSLPWWCVSVCTKIP